MAVVGGFVVPDHDVTPRTGAGDTKGDTCSSGHGNAVAIALSGLAVVFAASGTAYAVAAAKVTIADGTTPSRVAKVDAAGRLATVDPTSTVDITTVVYTNTSHVGEVYSSPTTATLAVTGFSVNALSTTSAPYAVYLFQVPVLADGTCSTTSTSRTLGYASFVPGSVGVRDYTSPITVTPIAGSKYCLDLYATALGTTANAGEALALQVTAYVAAGKYAGTGSAPTGTDATSKAAAVTGR